MNDLKFRVWDDLTQKFTYFGIRETMGVLPLDIPDENIQQFTGLIDANSQEIYEGDLVKTDTSHGYYEFSKICPGHECADHENGEVKFFNSCWNICSVIIGATPLNDYACCEEHPSALIIIGNNFQNAHNTIGNKE